MSAFADITVYSHERIEIRGVVTNPIPISPSDPGPQAVGKLLVTASASMFVGGLSIIGAIALSGFLRSFLLGLFTMAAAFVATLIIFAVMNWQQTAMKFIV